uniref:Putative secreted protein n=1 Tax=Anopheles triannulatus TaxID=58253 RepID=A0A2M4B518_9DIPT
MTRSFAAIPSVFVLPLRAASIRSGAMVNWAVHDRHRTGRSADPDASCCHCPTEHVEPTSDPDSRRQPICARGYYHRGRTIAESP